MRTIGLHRPAWSTIRELDHRSPVWVLAVWKRTARRRPWSTIGAGHRCCPVACKVVLALSGGAFGRTDRAERMLDCLTSRPHGVGIGIEPSLDFLDHMLMLPARDPALLGRRTLALDRAALARCCRPGTAQRHSMLEIGELIWQQLAGWAAVDILIRQVGEVLFAESALPWRSTSWAWAR
jgi:hypothetical protein